MTYPRLAARALRLSGEIVRSFFYPQFENALLGLRPVYGVDHPLDRLVPFDPSFVVKYLEFVRLWMASFYRLGRAYGGRALTELCGYVESIRQLYAEAGEVYGSCHTTTIRPSKNYNLRFAIIHATDPHLNCVPSLHVLIVVANWAIARAFVRDLRGRGEFLSSSNESYLDTWLEVLRDEAVAITESILFVKQHSINCIGASLFYLRRSGPRLADAELRELVDDLFEGRCRSILGDSTVAALRARALELYEELDAAWRAKPSLGWKGVLLDFIRNAPRRR
ncbi:MAG TPA: hypothetical protein VMC79_05170 [Rectinemataceae bacterium]|nr:hypothetical protein [Rectinemataceae bacterium]